MIRIAFIEDDAIYLKNLQRSVHLEPNIQSLIAAKSVSDFFEKIASRMKLDIIFLDIKFPEETGIDALPRIRHRFPKSEIIMLTQYEDEALLMQALNNGASGYLLKNFPVIQLPSYIRTIMNGGALVSPAMARILIDYFSPNTTSNDLLSARETQILRLIGEGNTYNNVAEALNISINSVKFHIKNAYKKLGVNNKMEAIKKFKEKDN